MNPNNEQGPETNENEVTTTPVVPEEEMKMPANTEPNQTSTPDKSEHLSAAIIAIIAVLLIFILTMMYVWVGNLKSKSSTYDVVAPTVERPTPEENNEPESTTAEAKTEMEAVLSPSDEIDAIEADVEATDLESLDAELDALDAELEAALNDM